MSSAFTRRRASRRDAFNLRHEKKHDRRHFDLQSVAKSFGSDQPWIPPIHSIMIRGAGLVARSFDSADQTSLAIPI